MRSSAVVLNGDALVSDSLSFVPDLRCVGAREVIGYSRFRKSAKGPDFLLTSS